MKVKELLKQLHLYDPETLIVVHGYDSGVNAAVSCKEVSLKLGVNSDWRHGNHVLSDETDCDVKALLIE